MARQRTPQGYSSPMAGGGIGQQTLYSPEWADIDFADFQGLNMNLVNQNAQFAQEIANDRLKEILKQRDALLEKVKLHKRDADLQGQLENTLSSIIDNMGSLQLSDAANYTALNTNLMRAKNDPVLQGAIKSSEDAKAYEQLKMQKPEIAEQPWNNANEKAYQAWLRGETNDFSINPIYKEYDLQTKADDFAKQVPADVRNAIVKYGVYGLQEKATEDKSVGKIMNSFNAFKQGLMQDPEFQSWYKRRGAYEKDRGGSIDDVINNIFKSSAAKFGTNEATVKVSMPQTDSDIRAGIDLAENARAQARFNAEQAAGFPSTTGAGKTKGSFVDYTDTNFVLDGSSMKDQSRNNALTNYLKRASNMKNKKEPIKVYGVEGGSKPYNSNDFPVTGNFRDNGDGTVSIEVKDNASATPKIGYIKADKVNFENSVLGNRTTNSTETVPSYLIK